jgi:hypothetical protein
MIALPVSFPEYSERIRHHAKPAILITTCSCSRHGGLNDGYEGRKCFPQVISSNVGVKGQVSCPIYRMRDNVDI